MGTCCNAHLVTKIREYARNAQNGAVTVTIIKNPKIIKNLIAFENPVDSKNPIATDHGMCDYCQAPAEFTCSYYPK